MSSYTSFSNKESNNEQNKETLSVTINLNKNKSVLVGYEQPRDLNKDNDKEDYVTSTLNSQSQIESITITIGKEDLANLLLSVREVFSQPQNHVPANLGRDFQALVGTEQFQIIAGYWNKNVDDQISSLWLNRVLNDCQIPADANGKYVSDLLKQAYFRVMDQFSTKRASITAPRIYARKVIVSVFAGD